MDTIPSGPTSSRRPRRTSFVARHLVPVDRLGELLFGIIMVLTITLGAGLVVGEGAEATTVILLGILGCNIAWGVIDGAMYIMSNLFERSLRTRLLISLQQAPDEGVAVAMVRAALDERLEPLTSEAERTRLYGEIARRLASARPEPARLTSEDLFGALASFLLVFVSAIPATIPFLVFADRSIALRVSNLLSLIMLFLVGYRWARATRSNPWIVGSGIVLAGLGMVLVAVALGG